MAETWEEECGGGSFSQFFNSEPFSQSRDPCVLPTSCYPCSLQDGSTLLHVASEHGHLDTALALLKKGVPLHMPNKVTWLGEADRAVRAGQKFPGKARVTEYVFGVENTLSPTQPWTIGLTPCLCLVQRG